MGYLLKEALKALCSGVNHWSYAVFWKIGCQNPKLLIWEECYYGTLPCSNAPHNSTIGNQGMSLQKQEGYHIGAQVGDRVHLLMDKMMMSNHVNLVGEGLVGRAAFTGNHEWIVSQNYNENAYPTEVLNEIRLQFSAGMQTIVVIPVIPHGVVLLGSPISIMENVAFVHDVKSLIFQLGCVPSAFISDNYITKDTTHMFGLPVADMTSMPINLRDSSLPMNSNPLDTVSFNLQRNSSQALGHANQLSSSLLTQFQDNLQVSSSSLMMPNLAQHSFKSREDHYAANVSAIGDTNVPSSVAMPSKPDQVINQPTFSNNPGSRINHPQSPSTSRSSTLLVSHRGLLEENHKISSASSSISSAFNANKGHHATSISCDISRFSGKSELNVGQSSQTSGYAKELVGLLNSVDQISNSSILTGFPNHGKFTGDDGHTANHVLKVQDNDACEGVFFQSSGGDDLFDVIGVDFKNKLLNNCQIKDFPGSGVAQNLGSNVYSDYGRVSESGVFSSFVSDHLLDAVISGVSSNSRQISDDNLSCRTTVSKISSSSVPSLSNMSEQMQGQLYGVSKPMLRLGEPVGSSIRSVSNKNDGRSCSLTSSSYGSQVSSWIEQGPSTSVSTANSKKPDEAGKSNRKRLKPGENPRPRPKDRQMIQDRVKELREIVPNGAKCSIDALLERTIKHMLFLQSVTKHADKLKQTVESKTANKEGGTLLKDNFEGGATWAFELGSQSMVCPIVVEDLNPPRQLLIEMLCEERGFFLEIADIIRGLGLTILKGIMEARNDKIWARFAVEANRDVTRMEVFISLVHLLEQTIKSSTASANATNDENMAAHPSSIPSKQQMVGPIVCGDKSAI